MRHELQHVVNAYQLENRVFSVVNVFKLSQYINIMDLRGLNIVKLQMDLNYR